MTLKALRIDMVIPQFGTRTLRAIQQSSAREAFKPIPVRCGEDRVSQLAFFVRQWIDLQLLTCVRFLRPRLARFHGDVLDVGCGAMPFRALLPNDVHYQGIDVPVAGSFGMHSHPEIMIFDGVRIPFPDCSWDGILCTEVLEHASDPEVLIAEMQRVLRPGGILLLTVPFAARVHHAPHDYHRFTRFRLQALLAGFNVEIEERGNDYAVIANKLVVLNARLLTGGGLLKRLLVVPIVGVALAPLAALALIAAHISMLLHLGSKDDPLGYGCSAQKA